MKIACFGLTVFVGFVALSTSTLTEIDLSFSEWFVCKNVINSTVVKRLMSVRG